MAAIITFLLVVYVVQLIWVVINLIDNVYSTRQQVLDTLKPLWIFKWIKMCYEALPKNKAED